MKTFTRHTGLFAALAGSVALAAMTMLSIDAWAAGTSGSTLQASKTLDICDNGDGTWKYSGEVSVWNTGVNEALGLNIMDCLQYKTATQSGQPQNVACLAVPLSTTTIPGLTQEINALTFPYDFTSVYTSPLDVSGTIRNSAQVNITNHSGGQVTGPNPKYTWTGGTPPSCNLPQPCGCTYTQGHWDNKPDVVWPAGGPQRTDPFFNSGLTYQQIMDTSDSGGNAYINLAHQYITAVLNVANGACEPSSVATYITLSTGFFSGFTTGLSDTTDLTGYYFCQSGNSPHYPVSCALEVTWAAILADYNQATGGYSNLCSL